MNSILKTYNKIKNADNIIIGAGAGLSIAAGLDTSIKTLRKIMPEYKEKYGIKDLYQGSFYPFKTINESFAYWSRAFYYWRYQINIFPLYKDLLELINDKNYL